MPSFGHAALARPARFPDARHAADAQQHSQASARAAIEVQHLLAPPTQHPHAHVSAENADVLYGPTARCLRTGPTRLRLSQHFAWTCNSKARPVSRASQAS